MHAAQKRRGRVSRETAFCRVLVLCVYYNACATRERTPAIIRSATLYYIIITITITRGVFFFPLRTYIGML